MPSPLPFLFDVEKFRLTFAEFGDVDLYPNPLIYFWAKVGEREVSRDRYQEFHEPALYCYIGHKITLAATSRQTADESGGIPGKDTGAITSKHIDGISKSMDVAISADKNAGEFNLTTYGLQFIHFRKMVSMGGFTTGYNQRGVGGWLR